MVFAPCACPVRRKRQVVTAKDPRTYLEPDMVRCYWRQIGTPGTLIREYELASGSGHSPRWADAVILPNVRGSRGDPQEMSWDRYHYRRHHPLARQSVVVVQAKASALGM